MAVHFFVLWDRFDHLKHHHRELFVWKLPSNSPALPMIELDGPCVRLKNTQPEGSMTATNDFGFSLRQQLLANTAPAMFAKDP